MEPSIRVFQFWGGLCVAAFCRHHRFGHRFIDELVYHHVELLRAPDLPAWDIAGARLAITGRGDAPPQEVLGIIPTELGDDFHRLIECATEIGIVDLYGAATDHPSRFLLKCLEVLDKHGIPKPREITCPLPAIVGFGEALGEEAFRNAVGRDSLPGDEE
ncbi:hypothetical protein [Luteolibacter sp. LG18]|uniref:hypothetical protein n=1 Tax=Luteolibacter sp. LG18 TaxID=2819286 RepID=UPI0030C759B4